MARKKKVSPVPKDMPTITAFLTVADVKKAADFYAKAFGFTLAGPMMKAGKLAVHATMKYGKSAIMLGCPMPGDDHATPAAQSLSSMAFGLYVYVEDVDALYKKVKRYKGVQVKAPEDMFWGDRTCEIVDRDGHHWTFASQFAKPTMEEMEAAMKAMMG